MIKTRLAFVRAALIAALAGILSFSPGSTAAAAPSKGAIADTYARIALAKYEDALTSARALKVAVDALVARPDSSTLAAARQAWLAARVPYQQTEVYRFGNPIVDDWEGRVNAWPLDEGLIDYVDAGYGAASDSNPFYTANVIANPLVKAGGIVIDATTITPALLADQLKEAGKIEANVATGYHAIEFLLWGQDLNGTGKGAGNRPATDFDPAQCTGGNCDRRVQYLTAATDLLITDLEAMVANWRPGGAAETAIKGEGDTALLALFQGLGSLSFGELAGERMKLGLLLNDPEEEHDCFSDNTHNSHFYNVVGMRAAFDGRYTRIDGSVVEGPSAAALLKATAPDIAARVEAAMTETLDKAQILKTRAETVEAYDQMIGEGNTAGNAAVNAVIEALIAQTKEFERAIAALQLKPIEFARSESLDDPAKVLQSR